MTTNHRPVLKVVKAALPRKSIPFSVKQRIWVKPCAVCGIPWDIHVDHIHPVALGGGPEPENLQPLCSACNYIKGKRRTNEEVAAVVAQRGLQHFMRAGFKHASRYFGPYDGPDIRDFARVYPEEHRLALALYAQFMEARSR